MGDRWREREYYRRQLAGADGQHGVSSDEESQATCVRGTHWRGVLSAAHRALCRQPLSPSFVEPRLTSIKFSTKEPDKVLTSMPELSKGYEPQAVEAKWYQFWLENRLFVANPNSTKPPFSIVIPPPNVTGILHMGHVLNNTIQDILSRKARMEGKEVLWLPGTDHAGISTQMVVERK